MTALKKIATIHSDFPTKFGIPRQSNIVEELQATIVFEPEYRNPDALRGLQDFSHIWLIWGFSETEREGWAPTVRPPRLGGNARKGVFATRSPYRPNALGLSSVVLERIERNPSLGSIIHVSGADLMDGTPIYDIKPYLPHVDCHPTAGGGFAGDIPKHILEVKIAEEWLALLPQGKRRALKSVLSHDPRPSYQDDPNRIYGMVFAGFEVKFSVAGNTLTVLTVEAV